MIFTTDSYGTNNTIRENTSYEHPVTDNSEDNERLKTEISRKTFHRQPEQPMTARHSLSCSCYPFSKNQYSIGRSSTNQGSD